jgi:hypothetical protein
VARIDSDPDNTTAFLAASGDAIEKRTREFVPDSDLLQVEQVCLVIDRTSGTSAE